jgi:hypothetical protein
MKLVDGDQLVSVCVVSGDSGEIPKPEPYRDALKHYIAEVREEISADTEAFATKLYEAAGGGTGNANAAEQADAMEDEADCGTRKAAPAKYHRSYYVHQARVKLAKDRYFALTPDEQRVYIDRAEEDARRYEKEMEEYNRLLGDQELLVGSLSGKGSRITVGSIPISRRINRGRALVKCKGDRICSVSMLSSADVDPNEGGNTSKPAAAPTASQPSVLRKASRKQDAAAVQKAAACEVAANTIHSTTDGEAVSVAPVSTPPQPRPSISGDLPPLWNDSALPPPLSLTPRRQGSDDKSPDEPAELASLRRSGRLAGAKGGKTPPWLGSAKKRIAARAHPPTPNRNRQLSTKQNASSESRTLLECKKLGLKPRVRLLGKQRVATHVGLRDVEIKIWAEFED